MWPPCVRPVIAVAKRANPACEAAGAHGITAHLREDRRHILDRDVRALRDAIGTRLNLEIANTPEILGIALKLKPDIVCVVPEKREEVTTEGGLDVVGNLESITEARKRLNDGGRRSDGESIHRITHRRLRRGVRR